jgi:MoxR-like ATPase
MNAKALKSALNRVSLDKRKRWARERWASSYGINPYCGTGCVEAGRVCSAPSHWAISVKRAAYAALVRGDGEQREQGETLETIPEVEAPEAQAQRVRIENETEALTQDPADPTAAVATALANLMGSVAGKVSRDDVVSIVGEQLGSVAQRVRDEVLGLMAPKRVVVEIGEAKRELEEQTHEAFAAVLKRASAGLNCRMVGPAGSGKTHLAAQIAKVMGRPFGFTSASETMDETSLAGIMLPTGDTMRFEFHAATMLEMYETGGVFLLDEGDAANPNVLAFLNAALANGAMSVPQRVGNPVAKRHPDFVFMMACNTYGHGGDRQYSARNQLDAATLDRFGVGTVTVGYDPKLERALVDPTWLEWGWAVREAIEKHSLPRIMSTRTMLAAEKLSGTGEERADVVSGYFADWAEDERAKLSSGILAGKGK